MRRQLTSFDSELTTDNRWLFGFLSVVPKRTRCTLMGVASGTRGGNVFFYKDGETRKIALTIDDAPSRSVEHFRQLLDVLKESRVLVTFQVISDHASTEEHVDLLRRAVQEGHQLTNHSTKDQKCLGLTEEEFEERLDACQTFIEGISPGVRKWFRPPSGFMNATMRRVLLRKGYEVCLGDCFSSDPKVDDVDFHVRTLSRAVRGGSVLILHCPESTCRQQTLELIPRLASELRNLDFEFATLDELFFGNAQTGRQELVTTSTIVE